MRSSVSDAPTGPASPASLLDAVSYAVWLTALVAVASSPVSLLVGAGLNGVKFGLFIVGFLCLGYAVLLLRRATSLHERAGGLRTETRFERLVGRLPPMRWYAVPVRARHQPGTKLFLASVTMLAVSYVMEAVFDIHV